MSETWLDAATDAPKLREALAVIGQERDEALVELATLRSRAEAAEARVAELEAERGDMRAVVEALVADWRDNWKNQTPDGAGRFCDDTGYPVSGSVYRQALDALTKAEG